MSHLKHNRDVGFDSAQPTTSRRLSEAEALLSDEQIEHYAAIFMALNERYELTKNHHFIFDDFLENPQDFERNIRLYFANIELFENRIEGGKIHLHIFLRYPQQTITAIKKMAAVAHKVDLKVDLTTEAWFQDLVAKTFERKHRVVMRGTALVELFDLNHHVERKCAGGQR